MWYFDNLGIIFLTGTVLLVLLSIIGSLHKKDNSDYVSPKKTDRLIKDEGSGSHKSENKKTDEPFDFEDAERRIAEMRKGIEEWLFRSIRALRHI